MNNSLSTRAQINFQLSDIFILLESTSHHNLDAENVFFLYSSKYGILKSAPKSINSQAI